MSSWRASASFIASGCSSHRRVEPSRSVNKKVTVPVGSSLIVQLRETLVDDSEHEVDELVERHGHTPRCRLVVLVVAKERTHVLAHLDPLVTFPCRNRVQS